MTTQPLKLGVNIDHVATLRQARGTPYPDVVEAARASEEAGADGITVHLREDRRHIQDRDVFALRRAIRTLLNLEMANSPEIVRIALEARPDEVCIVPERRAELTTEGGLDVAGNLDALKATTAAFAAQRIDVSLFIDPDPGQIDAAAQCRAPTIELHTGAFCAAAGAAAEAELQRLIAAARRAQARGLRVNAGHGINLQTIGAILRIPHLDTLNIGHSVVSRAVMIGLRQAVAEMREAMRAYRGGEPAGGGGR